MDLFLGHHLTSHSPSSSPTTLMSCDLPATNSPVTPLMLSSQQAPSKFSPTQSHVWPLHTAQQISESYQSYHSTTSSYPPPPVITNFNSHPNSRGIIIYPEFVNHLEHPDVDSFKDIPKLPGQSDFAASPATSFSICTTSYGLLPQEMPQTPPTYTLIHSPIQPDSPVHLSEEDLQQILELNKDSMYN